MFSQGCSIRQTIGRLTAPEHTSLIGILVLQLKVWNPLADAVFTDQALMTLQQGGGIDILAVNIQREFWNGTTKLTTRDNSFIHIKDVT